MDYLCYLCLVFFFMILHLFIAALWSPDGKGLTSWLLFVMFSCVFVTFSCGILGQVWYRLYQFLIFAAFLTLIQKAEVCFAPCIISAAFCSKSVLVRLRVLECNNCVF